MYHRHIHLLHSEQYFTLAFEQQHGSADVPIQILIHQSSLLMLLSFAPMIRLLPLLLDICIVDDADVCTIGISVFCNKSSTSCYALHSDIVLLICQCRFSCSISLSSRMSSLQARGTQSPFVLSWQIDNGSHHARQYPLWHEWLDNLECRHRSTQRARQ